MKREYITPEALTVMLGTKQTMLTESVPVVDDDPVDPGDFETKENKNFNIWDEEW